MAENTYNQESQIDEIKQDVKEILHILNGNGKMGLVAKVAVLWGTSIFMLSAVAIQLMVLLRVMLA